MKILKTYENWFKDKFSEYRDKVRYKFEYNVDDYVEFTYSSSFQARERPEIKRGKIVEQVKTIIRGIHSIAYKTHKTPVYTEKYMIETLKGEWLYPCSG